MVNKPMDSTFHRFVDLPLELQYKILTDSPELIVKAAQLCHTTRELVRSRYRRVKCEYPITDFETHRYLASQPHCIAVYVDLFMCYVMRLDKTKENYDCLYLRVHVDHNRLLYMCNRVETIPVHTLRTWLVYTNYQLDLFSTFTVMKERLKNEAICERILAYQYKINLERLTSMKELSTAESICALHIFLFSHLMVTQSYECTPFSYHVDVSADLGNVMADTIKLRSLLDAQIQKTVSASPIR